MITSAPSRSYRNYAIHAWHRPLPDLSRSLHVFGIYIGHLSINMWKRHFYWFGVGRHLLNSFKISDMKLNRWKYMKSKHSLFVLANCGDRTIRLSKCHDSSTHSVDHHTKYSSSEIFKQIWKQDEMDVEQGCRDLFVTSVMTTFLD